MCSKMLVSPDLYILLYDTPEISLKLSHNFHLTSKFIALPGIPEHILYKHKFLSSARRRILENDGAGTFAKETAKMTKMKNTLEVLQLQVIRQLNTDKLQIFWHNVEAGKFSRFPHGNLPRFKTTVRVNF